MLAFTDEAAICFLGDGAVAQGAFHESLNLASLWDLPCVYVIENNIYGMGTHVRRAISAEKMAEQFAVPYNMKSYTLDGTNFFNCYAAFREAFEEVKKTSRPVLIEAIAERFKGHSVSDPGQYRTKEDLQTAMQIDPLTVYKKALIEAGLLTEEEYKEIDKQQREIVLAAMKYAEESPWPDVATLEEDVFAP